MVSGRMRSRARGGLLARGTFLFFQAEDGIRDWSVTGVQTCALPISAEELGRADRQAEHRAHGAPDREPERDPPEACRDVAAELAVAHEVGAATQRRLGAQIGRASCRGRGWSWGGGGTVKRQRESTRV